MQRSQLKGVPVDRVGEVTQAFVADGFTRITCTRANDGTWTITASRSNRQD